MRKLGLTLVVAAAALSLAALTQRAEAMTPAGAGGMRAAIEHTSSVDQVRWVCKRVWSGRLHRSVRRCFWTPPRHRHRHHHHYR